MLIEIELSPFQPNLATAYTLAICIGARYSEQTVDIIVNPNITEYKSNEKAPGVAISQFMVMESTEHTRVLHFDFLKQNKHNVRIAGKTYEIQLMSIRKNRIADQAYFRFEFQVSESSVVPGGILKEGTILYSCSHSHRGWWNDENSYQFGPFQFGELGGITVKHPDKMVEVTVFGPLGEVFRMKKPIPDCSGQDKLQVAITWKDDVVTFYLNGAVADLQSPGQ